MTEQKIAFVFPGQASQHDGMFEPLLGIPRFCEMLDTAEQLTGLSLRDNPGSTDTKIAQVALYLVEIERLRQLRDAGFTPTITAGHSLGEIPALVAAESISANDGLRLIIKRSQYMGAACDDSTNPGGMMVVMARKKEGDTIPVRDEVVALIEGVPNVWVTNDNSLSQAVVSGTPEGLAAASELLGAYKLIPLTKVGGAFHSELMGEASEAFRAELDSVLFCRASCHVIQNFRPWPNMLGTAIKTQLAEQMLSPVRWREIMQVLIDKGVTRAIEVGPGNVLAGFAKGTKLEVVGVEEFLESVA